MPEPRKPGLFGDSNAWVLPQTRGSQSVSLSFARLPGPTIRLVFPERAALGVQLDDLLRIKAGHQRVAVGQAHGRGWVRRAGRPARFAVRVEFDHFGRRSLRHQYL